MKLTPEILAEHYDWLRSVKPFCDWKMPARHRMMFRITKNKNRRGYFRPLEKHWVIAISEENNKSVGEVQLTMAHEMIHAHIEMRQPRAPHHGELFQECAKIVCDWFGFDREKF